MTYTSNMIRLLDHDGSWDSFAEDWKVQCEKHGEEFDSYAEATFSVVRDIVKTEHARAGVFAMHDGVSHLAMCQVNVAPLPGYDSPVMRVRFITLSPEYDLTDKTISEYGDVLVGLLGGILGLSYLDDALTCRHIKFHLRSPADQQFFRALGMMIQSEGVFEKIEAHGAWLYITKK